MSSQLHDANPSSMRKDAENGRLVADMHAEHPREPLAAHAVTPAEEDAALRGRSTEPASRPEHDPEDADGPPTVHELLDLHEFIIGGHIAVVSCGDTDDRAGRVFAHLVREELSGYSPAEIGTAILDKLGLAA